MGADVLRLWIASADFSGEMTVSDEILNRAGTSIAGSATPAISFPIWTVLILRNILSITPTCWRWIAGPLTVRVQEVTSITSSSSYLSTGCTTSVFGTWAVSTWILSRTNIHLSGKQPAARSRDGSLPYCRGIHSLDCAYTSYRPEIWGLCR